MARITLTINESERKGLIALSERERRDPRNQAALLIRQALEHAGALPATEQPPVEDGELEENTTPLVSMNLAQDRQIADLYSRIKALQERVDDLEFELAKIRKEGDK